MVDPSDFREIISGRKRGIAPTIIRGILALGAAIYATAVAFRNRLFDVGWKTIHRGDVPVISVGNLTVGGTGKSPFVLWLARYLQRLGKSPAVLSRGYGAVAGSPNDEALELRLRAPDLCHLQSADRAAIARRAVEEFAANVLILDDGFQHRRLARHLDLVLIDATEPFGYERLLPRGLLREPIGSLRRASAVVLTRANQISDQEKQRIRQIVASHAPNAIWCEAQFDPSSLVDDQGRSYPLTDLKTARVFGFAAIGQPDNFRWSLNALTGSLVGFQSFPDHHRFTRDEIAGLVATAQTASADFLVCTCKDLVKIAPGSAHPIPLRAVQIDTRITAGQLQLENLLGSIAMLGERGAAAT